MQHRRVDKPDAAPSRLNGHSPHATDGHHVITPKSTTAPDRGGDTETREALARLTGMVERLMEKVKDVQKVQEAAAEREREGRRSDPVSRFTNGRASGLVNLSGSLTTLWQFFGPLVSPVFVAVALGLLKSQRPPAGVAPAWSAWDLVRPLLPMAAAIALASLLIVASRWIKQKSRRLRFLMAVMGCYGTATVLYLAWLSLGFLRFNTLAGGVLLTLTWVAIVSIVRRAPGEWREMRELMRVQLEKGNGESQKTAPPSKGRAG